MPPVTGDVPLREDLDALLRASPLYATLGMELLGWGPGSARVAMVPGPAHGNIAGSVHGGVVTSLADAAFEASCNGYGRQAVALEMTAHYVSAARIGEPLEAVAEEVSRSRRVASYRIEVRGGGELRAWFMAVAYRTER
jgi:phenylacetic acid degradation protein PaaD